MFHFITHCLATRPFSDDEILALQDVTLGIVALNTANHPFVSASAEAPPEVGYVAAVIRGRHAYEAAQELCSVVASVAGDRSIETLSASNVDHFYFC